MFTIFWWLSYHFSELKLPRLMGTDTIQWHPRISATPPSLDPNSSGKASSHNGYINRCWPMISLGIILPTILGIIIIHELGTPMNIQFLLKWLMTLRFSLGFAGNQVPIFSGWSLLRPRFKGHFFLHNPSQIFEPSHLMVSSTDGGFHRIFRGKTQTLETVDHLNHGHGWTWEDAEATWLSNHITSCILYIYNIYIKCIHTHTQKYIHIDITLLVQKKGMVIPQ